MGSETRSLSSLEGGAAPQSGLFSVSPVVLTRP